MIGQNGAQLSVLGVFFVELWPDSLSSLTTMMEEAAFEVRSEEGILPDEEECSGAGGSSKVKISELQRERSFKFNKKLEKRK